MIQLIEAGKDTSKMLDFVDKALHQMAFAVEPAIIFAQDCSPLVRWNNGLNAPMEQIVDEMRCRVASISNESLKVEAFQQMLRLGDVMPLAGRQAQSQRIAQPINRYMDFGGEAASTSPQCLWAMFFSAPAAQG